MTIKIPYRINWAGAYIDCIEEPVITSTIDKYLTFNCTERDDNIVIVDSKEFPGLCITDLSPHKYEGRHWSEYVNGCIFAFIRNNFKLHCGCNIEVINDLPSGIGISSSAAFIVGIIQCLCWANDIIMSTDLIAHLGYWVEHDYLNIPCGRMDFKAILHEPGIWKIDTADISLANDYLISNKHYTGLLLYKEQHEHLTDEKFINLVRDIKDAKNNFKKNLVSQYIDFEKTIVTGITYEAQEGKLNEGYLGMFMNQAYLNMLVNLFNQECKYTELDGLYGEKLLGSGLKGARFLLIDPAHKEQIIKLFEKDYHVAEIKI